MKKETLVDKLAKKAFFDSEVQKSWSVHMQAFGPILEPAFADDYETRVNLTAALNKISRRDLKGGLEKLKHLQGKCITDADKAAWLFFMGVCFEMAGAKEQMLSFYQQAGNYDHRFYLPYLKIAKSAYGDMVLEIAESNYQKAIACFEKPPLDARSKTVLASAYTNLASCLTMMHRFDDAQEALNASCRIAPILPGRSGTAAILYAAAGKAQDAAASLDKLKAEAPQMFSQTNDVVEKILTGTHPHFFPQPLSDAAIAEFWTWFARNESRLSEKIAQQDYDGASAMLHEQMAPLFAFSDKSIELALSSVEGVTQVSMADFFSVGLKHAYEALLTACPEQWKQRWQFIIVR